MHRRIFLGLATATLLTTPVLAEEHLIPFEPGVIQEALDAGKTVFVDYFAPWCVTCRAQERRVEELRAENPAYDESITFIRVDWDTYRSHPVTTSRAIPRRSTLLMLRGDAELGRIVAGTRKSDIKALMDWATNAERTG